jgi:hypothetical protein
MRTTKKSDLKCFLALILSTVFIVQALTAQAQGTAFTYQGRLNSNGGAATGSFDFRFRLAADNQGNNYVGSAFITNAVTVTNGLFVTTIDFGTGIFEGAAFWLEVDVRTNGATGYTALYPLQALTPAPYAIMANSASNVLGNIPAAQITGAVGSANLSGDYGNSVSFNNAGNSFTGNGAGLADVNASTLNGLSPANFWQTAGNSGTAPGANYIGTSDNQPLELHVNNLRVMRLEFGGASSSLGLTTPNGAPNVIGGSPSNFVSAGVVGCVIGGGGATNWSGAVIINSIGANSDFSVIGGGYDNAIETNSSSSFIGGGQINTILPESAKSTVVGGYGNGIFNNSDGSAIGGGEGNNIYPYADHAVIGGGLYNTMGSNNYEGVIAGGYQNYMDSFAGYSFMGSGELNYIMSTATFSSVVGGFQNTIGTNTPESFIGGGQDNTISGDNTGNGNSVIVGGSGSTIYANSYYSVIGGGNNNNIGSNSESSVIAGGNNNAIQNNGSYNSVIGGGYGNTIGNNCGDAAIAGGYANAIQNNSYYSVIAGGIYNVAGPNAPSAFAAGSNAKAVNSGAFVWSDGSATTSSTVNDSVTFRASGGYRFFTGSGTGGATLAAGATSWTTLSDRNAKKDFAPVDYQAVLDKLAQVPIEQWHYKWEKSTDTLNIGPMAQDFKGAFFPGRDDKGISTLEFDGVELAAIQGLNQKLSAELNRQAAENSDLKARLEKLEKMMSELAVKR